MGLRARITASGESIRRRRPVADIGNCITVREVGNVGQGKFVFVVQKKVTTVKRAISDNVLEISQDKLKHKSSDRSSKKKIS